MSLIVLWHTTRILKFRWCIPFHLRIVYHDRFSNDGNRAIRGYYYVGIYPCKWDFRASPFYSHRDKSLTGAILNNIHPAFSSALRDVEHWDLTGSSTTPVSLSSPAKVRLIHFNLPGNSKKSVTIRTDDWLPIQVEEIVDRVIGWTKLMSGFSNYSIQLEKFDRDQDTNQGNSQSFKDTSLSRSPPFPTTA